MLIEVWGRVGIRGMARVELGTKRNAHQSLAALSGMSSGGDRRDGRHPDRLGRKDTGRMKMVEGKRPGSGDLTRLRDGAAGFAPQRSQTCGTVVLSELHFGASADSVRAR